MVKLVYIMRMKGFGKSIYSSGSGQRTLYCLGNALGIALVDSEQNFGFNQRTIQNYRSWRGLESGFFKIRQ